MNRFQRIPIAWFHVKPESSAARRGEVELPHRSKDMQHFTQAAFLSTLAIRGSAGGHAVAMRLRPRIASPVEGSSMTIRDREQIPLCYGEHVLVRITVLLLPEGSALPGTGCRRRMG